MQFFCVKVCRDWRVAGDTSSLWQHHFYERGFHSFVEYQSSLGQDHPRLSGRTSLISATLPTPTMYSSDLPPSKPPHVHEAESSANKYPSWRERYIEAVSHVCFDCLQRTHRTTIKAAPLCFNLCRACWEGYESRKQCQRLVTKGWAKFGYCLRDADLCGVPYASDVNIVDARFTSMTLFRKVDMRAIALTKWGGKEGLEKELRKRRRI